MSDVSSKRKGPRPLSVQIGMAVSAFAKDVEDRDAQQEMLRAMLLGIQKYQTHPWEADMPPLCEVWRAGEAALKTLAEENTLRDGAPAMLLVPSLINRANIFNLTGERSMLRFLQMNGIQGYIIDWGDIASDPGQADLEKLIGERLLPAADFLKAQHGGGVHALGYCMGGTILAAAASINPAAFASAVFLAAPWDFHAGSQALLNRVKFWTPNVIPSVLEKGVLPVDWIQVIFASLDPAMVIGKFAQFFGLRDAPEREKIFVAVEDWLNDGVDLPAGIALECIQDWFIGNAPVRGAWMQQGRVVDPANITCPALVIASRGDRLVEFDMAAALHAAIPGAALLTPSCGHIGMIAGQKAVEDVWKPVAEWVMGLQG